MIQVTPQMRIVAAVEPADFRRGIDGLARLCKDVLKHDPFNGWVFVFRNRSAKALKILVYDGQGFWLCHKRLSSGCFVSFRQACMNRFEACGIVGCQLADLWRTADGYPEDTQPSGAAGRASAAVRALAWDA